MAFADSTKYNTVRSLKGLPIGAIIPWSSDQSNIPRGWTICNGRVISNTTYPLLYEVIGNAYGGTEGSTYKLPPLTNNPKGIVDIFRGHYNYLRGRGDAYSPETSSIANDRFWQIVGGGNNGDEGSSTQTDWQSTADIFGEFLGSPNFFASYEEITIADGSFSDTTSYTERRLYDYHLQSHTHGVDNEEVTSLSLNNNRAVQCYSGAWADAGGSFCRVNCNRTSVRRVAGYSAQATGRIMIGNNETDFQDAWGRPRNMNSTYTRPGGGGNGGQAAVGETSSAGTVYINGDGFCGGSMSCGGDTLFTSLSNSQKNIGDVAPHEHGTSNYNFTGRYSVISPGIRNDISINTVRIDNQAGVNFCTILANTATPSLEMLYIIRAY
jgi:hypothetical protein